MYHGISSKKKRENTANQNTNAPTTPKHNITLRAIDAPIVPISILGVKEMLVAGVSVMLLGLVDAKVPVVLDFVVLAAVVVHDIYDIDPDEPTNMLIFAAIELTHATPHRTWLKDAAFKNIQSMLVTRATSHLDRSWLKDVAP